MNGSKPSWPSTNLEDLSPREKQKLLDVVRSYQPEQTRSWGWIVFWLIMWLAALGVIITLVT